MFLEQQISILESEGSCDTKDWSNNDETNNFTFVITGINLKL